MIQRNSTVTFLRLSVSTVALLVMSAQAGMAQDSGDCLLLDGVIDPTCEWAEAGTAVTMPVGENTELDNVDTLPDQGFAITINDQPVVGDRQLATSARIGRGDTQRTADIVLARAKVQVKFDGLDVRPRLDLAMSGKDVRQGADVTFESQTNYPAWISRGELRFVEVQPDRTRRTVKVVNIPANGRIRAVVPQGDTIVAVHRVYDADGRYNETAELPVTQEYARTTRMGAEQGTDQTARQGFRVVGGAVTVSGQDVVTGGRVQTLGEVITADSTGRFVVQRILPTGDHGISVRINGTRQKLDVMRDITIPASEWFYVATADVTLGKRLGDGLPAAGSDTYSHGRVAFYAKGKTASGYEITASVDSGEEELSEIFSSLDEKDPRHLLIRFDDDRGFPVYGDDSTAQEDAPTSGKCYVKVERDNNSFLWGNYQGRVASAEYIRNDRTLYGAQVHWETRGVTKAGDARAEVTAFAAQPDNLPGRDVFRGTGGSVYFLSRQDISLGSDALFVEIVDPITRRVIDRVELTAGRDYQVNYLQGMITLSGPLSGCADLSTSSVLADEDQVQLVANYEFTPTSADVDTFSYGGRAQAWLGDQWRVGVTGMVEDRGTTDHRLSGADVRYQHSENSFAELEFARSQGSANASTYSADGGFVIDTTTPTGQQGRALRFNAAVDLSDVNADWAGRVTSYAELREAGFSTQDYDVATDETLWGIAAEFAVSEHTEVTIALDGYENDASDLKNKAAVEAVIEASDRLTWKLGVSHLDQVQAGSATETGSRTEVAVRADMQVSDTWTVSPFLRFAASTSGGMTSDDRVGVAGKYIGDSWSFEGEVSGGETGLGLRAIATQTDEDSNSTYFGYELTPDRALNGVTLQGRDNGRFVAGGKRRLNDMTTAWGENTFDLFRRHQSLSATYGVDYAPTEHLSYSTSIERGEISDDINGDFQRTAMSFGLRYDGGAKTLAKARFELRRERGVAGGAARDVDSVIASGTLRYKLSEDARLLASLHPADTTSNNVSFNDGTLTEVTLGYAYRPVANDKLNTLFKYTYLRDMYGQTLNGTDTTGPRQESHVLNWDVEYDLDRH